MEILIQKRNLILDGGLGTTLEDEHSVKFTPQTPLWSSHLLLSDPATLQRVQTDFWQAGADIILTPTYQASHVGFRKTRPDITSEEVIGFFEQAISISRQASQGKGLVALSLGAYGAILQPSQEYSGQYGTMTEEDLVEFHSERILAINLSDVDIIAFETLPRLNEIRAVKQVVDGSKPYWISCVFPTDDKLPDGSTIEEALLAMVADPKPWAIGINCTKIHKIADLVEKFEAVAAKHSVCLPRLVLYPDGTNGQVYDTTKQLWVGEESSDGLWHEKMYQIGKEICDRGAWEGLISGGCCKTTPNHIRDLRSIWATSLVDTELRNV